MKTPILTEEHEWASAWLARTAQQSLQHATSSMAHKCAGLLLNRSCLRLKLFSKASCQHLNKQKQYKESNAVRVQGTAAV